MTHRERVQLAVNHEEPDRVPFDLGGTFATSINVAAYERLRSHLGIQSETVLASRRSQIPVLDERVLAALDIDTRCVLPGGPDKRPETLLPDGSYQDEWGVVRSKPSTGHYIDSVNPLAGEYLSVTDVESYDWPDPDDPGYTRGVAERARRLHEGTDYAVILCLPVGIVHQSQFQRGYEQWMVDILGNQEVFEALLDRTLDIWLRMSGNLLEAAGPWADIVMWGDDIAGQNGCLVSPDLYRRLIKPRHRRIFDFIKARTRAKVMYHCCGSVYSIIPDLIDMGMDILTPVQVDAASMDTALLKREFGHQVTFWGGIDTHRVLAFGTPSDVRGEVRRRLRDMAPGGGYVLNAVHNIQPEVPPENIVAMFETGREFGRYPIT